MSDTKLGTWTLLFLLLEIETTLNAEPPPPSSHLRPPPLVYSLPARKPTRQGSFMQPQGHVQLLMNMLVRGMDPQAAIDAPRFCIRGGVVDAKIGLESWLPRDSNDNETGERAGKDDKGASGQRAGGECVAEELRKMGHNIVVVRGHDRAEMGRAQV